MGAVTRIIAGLLLLAAAGCAGAPHGGARGTTHIDLLARLGSAEKRPSPANQRLFSASDVDLGGRSRWAVIVPQPSRLTWALHIPVRATLTTAIGIVPGGGNTPRGDAAFRIGISDNRVYEILYRRLLRPREQAADRGWVPVTVDLSRYAGWQWSLFYQPSRRLWQLIFSVDGEPSAAGDTPAWAAPVIEGPR
jgi:hypothetical protein